eukprot:symbB.v1.2.003911.t1/scaffold210.1/size302740/2
MPALLEKIATLELEISRTQKNKATAKHLGDLKAKLCAARRELLSPEKSGGGGKSKGFEVQRFGDSRVALIGFPSVGKSSLLTALTGVQSEAAAYEFTTLTCIPGVINYNDCKIQLLDLPGIISVFSLSNAMACNSTSRSCSLFDLRWMQGQQQPTGVSLCLWPMYTSIPAL